MIVSQMLSEDGRELLDLIDLANRGGSVTFTLQAQKDLVDGILLRFLLDGQDSREPNFIARIDSKTGEVDLIYPIDLEYALNRPSARAHEKRMNPKLRYPDAHRLARGIAKESGSKIKTYKKQYRTMMMPITDTVREPSWQDFLFKVLQSPQKLLKNFVCDTFGIVPRGMALDECERQVLRGDNSIFDAYTQRGFDFENVVFPDGSKLDGLYIANRLRELCGQIRKEIDNGFSNSVRDNISGTNYSKDIKDDLLGRVGKIEQRLLTRLSCFEKELEGIDSRDSLSKVILTKQLQEASSSQSTGMSSWASFVKGKVFHSTSLYEVVSECADAKGEGGKNLFNKDEVKDIIMKSNSSVKWQASAAIKRCFGGNKEAVSLAA